MLKSLFKDTAIYGLSSIVGRFLNYLLVPIYTVKISAASGGYGVVTNVYAYTALLMVLLTYGMETTLFRYANKPGQDLRRVYSTVLASVGTTALGFVVLVLLCLGPVSRWMGYPDHPEWIGVMAVVVAIDVVRCFPFALLRLEQKAMKFAALQLFNILLTIALNLIYFFPLGGSDVSYIFYINLVSSVATTLMLCRELSLFRLSLASGRLLREMLRYAWPILVLGLAGILNQTADKLLFPYIYKGDDAMTQLGIYGASVKIAMIMAMITQAFRYAYEPFIFGGARRREQDQKQTQAQAMLWFVLFTLLAYLAVVGYMPLLRHLIGRDYWSGLRVVPIVMAAEIMMGVYFNLSFWYKLTDRTVWGAVFSGVGCAVLVGVNVAFVPRYGYMACAWGGVAGYGTAMLLSYVVGQHYYPIRFPLLTIFGFAALCAVLAWPMTLAGERLSMLPALAVNSALMAVFAAAIAATVLRQRRRSLHRAGNLRI
jgi:O-antigen/teichoic acid export membrane protein